MKRLIRRCQIIFLAAVAISSAFASQAQSDGEILTSYKQLNSFDVERGLLGALRGHSSSVRELGEMVAIHHNKVRIEVATMARQMDVNLAMPNSYAELEYQHYQTMSELQSLTGSTFDKAFIAEELKLHAATIKYIETIFLPAAKDLMLAAHFKQKLPDFRHHLHHTQMVAKELGYLNQP